MTLAVETNETPTPVFQDPEQAPVESESEIDSFKYSGVSGSRMFLSWIRLLPLNRRIDYERSDAITKILRQQTDIDIEIRNKDAAPTGISETLAAQKFVEVRAEVSEWLKAFSTYEFDMMELRSAKTAFNQRLRTLEILKEYWIFEEAGIRKWARDLSEKVQGRNRTSANNKPERPLKIVKTPILYPESVDYRRDNLREKVDIPSSLNSAASTSRQIKFERARLERIEELMAARSELQAILFARLERLTHKPLSSIGADEALKIERDDRGVIMLDDMSKAKDLSDLQKLVARNLLKLFKDQDALKKLTPPAEVINEYEAARTIDRESTRRWVPRSIKQCRNAIGLIGKGGRKLHHAISKSADYFSTPAKIGLISAGFTAIGAGAVWIYSAVDQATMSETRRRLVEAEEKAKQKKLDLEAREKKKAEELELIIGTAQDAIEFEDRFSRWAHTYWSDEGVRIFEQYRAGFRSDIEPRPSELTVPDKFTGKPLEQYMFDHADEVANSYTLAWNRVKSRLDGRRENQRLLEIIKKNVENNGLEKSFKPPEERSPAQSPSPKGALRLKDGKFVPDVEESKQNP